MKSGTEFIPSTETNLAEDLESTLEDLGGPATAYGGLAYDLYNISRLPPSQQLPALNQELWSLNGALYGSEFGAEVGSIGGPVGSIVGGLIGGLVGGFAGNSLASWFNNVVNGGGSGHQGHNGSNGTNGTNGTSGTSSGLK